MKKIYARQVAPEYQDSYIFADDMYSDDCINVWGNPRYTEHVSDIFRGVIDCLRSGELADILDDIDGSEYDDASDALSDFLPTSIDGYSDDDIAEISRCIRKYAEVDDGSPDARDIICRVMDVVTGKKWDWQTIRGSSQSDCNYVFFRMDCWTAEAIERFETLYYNEGTEWIIHDDEIIPDTPADISGYSVYCTSWGDEGIRAEIADAAGCAPADVMLYEFDGWKRIPKYKEA